ncbi:MAG: hypothetical protein KGD64_09775 [Candidatus Heimdallarchaeota archaeon]|nr:hypothetical protein [Candidatus Heimdallarchaeota archaeon]
MSEQPKKIKQIKGGKKLKTQAAVVPKQRKLRKKQDKLPAALMIEKKIKPLNIVFTIIFGASLITTIVMAFLYSDLQIAGMPSFLTATLFYVAIGINVFLLLISFETYRVEFKPTILRIIGGIFLFILLPVISWPFILFKWHSRHNIWRILFTGFTIYILLMSFMGPYLSMLDKYRDLPPGVIDEQLVNPDWFNANFQGSAPFYIDGLLDLLDALDFNSTLGDQEIANVFTDGYYGDLGNFLYRWEVHTYYDSTTWEFTSNDAVTYDLAPENYGVPSATTKTGLNISQLIFTATSSITDPLLTTLSSYYNPSLNVYDSQTVPLNPDWDNYLLDENGSVAAVDGSTEIVYSRRNQLLLQSSAEILGFVGTYNYQTYFVQDETQTIIDDCLDYYAPGYDTLPRVQPFLQVPTNYDTISPGVVGFAVEVADETTGYTIYERADYILNKILMKYGTPIADQTDNAGRDRAQLLIEESDSSISAFLALAIMTMRLNDIPARPVFGFAIGSPNGGDPNNRTLAFANLYGWIEALLPIDEGGGDPVHRWGQLQIGPYPYGGDFVYCENTLHSSYDVDVSMYEFPTYNALPTQNVGGDEVYVIDNLQYVVRADIINDNSDDEEGVLVNFKAVSAADYQTYQSNPTQLLSVADDLGADYSSDAGSFGRAEVFPTFNSTAYPTFNPSDPDSTTYIVFAFVSFTSLNATGFIILPEGYLSSVSMNATQQVLPSPENPAESYNYLIAQKGFMYAISTTLYEDVAHTTVLSGRYVSYYILTADELQQLQLGLIGPEDVTKIGDGLTNLGGSSTVYSNDGTTDYFALPEDTTYFLVANYGQNYTFSVMLLIDFMLSDITLNDTLLDVALDGFILYENFDLYLYLQPLLGSPEALDGESIQVWFIQETDYEVHTGTKDVATYKSELAGVLNSTIPYNKIVLDDVTDANGFVNATILVDARNHGAGSFVFIVFYLDRWNASESVFISTPPGSFAVEMEYNDYEDSMIFDKNYSTDLTSLESFVVVSLSFFLCIHIPYQPIQNRRITMKERYL